MNRYTPAERQALSVGLGLLVLLAGVAFHARPLTPIDETRYISVAWEMWLRGDLLVPFKNGAPYSHKPPLLMWLYHLGWAVFGVNEWWPRLVSPLFSAAGLVLTLALARRLWPQQSGLAARAVLVLASSLLWMFFSTSAMFDVMLATIALVGLHGIVTAAEGGARRGFAQLAVAIGLGVLAKGPVILLHTLPVAVLAPWWHPGLAWKRWAGGIAAALAGGAAIALAWAIPAGFAGGDEYRHAIFWGQTADRMVQSFAHKRPLWWYLPLLPVMLFPWFLSPGVWRGFRGLAREGLDRGSRFCLAWLLPVFAAFSLISGKQMHYLVPIFPAFALLTARALRRNDVDRGAYWLPALAAAAVAAGLAALALGWIRVSKSALAELPQLWPALLLAVVVLVGGALARRGGRRLLPLVVLGAGTVALVQLSLTKAFFGGYDVRPVAEAIAKLQAEGHTVANDDFYHDQFHFAGRLRTPLRAFEETAELRAWLRENPDGYAVLYLKNEAQLAGRPVVVQHRYLGEIAVLLPAPAALDVLNGN